MKKHSSKSISLNNCKGNVVANKKSPFWNDEAHFREQKKITQEVLSGLADIGRTHLSAIERGERKPTLETFFKIADALEIPPSEIMKEIEKEIKR